MRVFLEPVLLVILAVSCAACDGGLPPWQCKDPCPTGMKRDFFCRCYNPNEKPTTPTNPGAEQNPISSACVCDRGDGQYDAWFRFRPPNYGSLVGKTVRVAASPCEDLRVCPIVGPKQEQRYVQGLIKLKVQVQRYIENYISGGQSWVLQGQITDFNAGNAPREVRPPLALRTFSMGPASSAAKLSPRPSPAPLAQGGAQTVAKSASIPPYIDCIDHCGKGDEFCLSASVPSPYDRMLNRFVEGLIDAKPSSITKRSLTKTFGLTSDPCNRGDTDLRGGRVRNTGDECIVAAEAKQGDLRAALVMPKVLEGSWSLKNDLIAVEFTNQTFAPFLRFNDPPTEDDFGGYVRRALLSRTSVIMETANACVQGGR